MIRQDDVGSEEAGTRAMPWPLDHTHTSSGLTLHLQGLGTRRGFSALAMP